MAIDKQKFEKLEEGSQNILKLIWAFKTTTNKIESNIGDLESRQTILILNKLNEINSIIDGNGAEKYSMVESLKKHLDVPKNMEDAIEYFSKDTFSEIRLSQFKRFHNKITNKKIFDDFINKVNEKYDTNEYVNRYYRRGLMPQESLRWFLYNYASIYGREATKKEYKQYGNDFTTSIYYINGYYIQKISGQGVGIIMHKKVKIPKYVFMVFGDENSEHRVGMKLKKNKKEYYRTSGQWSVGYEIEDGVLISKNIYENDFYDLSDKLLIACTEKEYMDDEGLID